MAVFRDVVQAARDYVGTTDDEVTVLQGRLLYLLEQFYDGWAKVQVHTSQYFLFSPRVGLIPSACIEPAPPVYRATAVYDYQANGGELSMKKKDTMNVYFQEGGMALVKIDRKDAFSQSAVGYVPVHYIKPGEGNVELQVHTTAAAARAGGIRSLIEVSTTAVLCDVMKATYDYAATADDEVTVAEDQLLYLLENPEENWAKVRVHAPPYSVSPTRVGLVPSSYIEPAPPMYRAIALYDYEADREGEISMKENETMNVYLEEDGWILVKIDRKDTVRGPAVGFVPANYIEKVGGDVESSADPSEEVFKDHTTAAAARAGGIIAVPLYDFEAEGDDELTVKEGERLTILDKEDDEWWKCRNWTGNEGIVPASYLEIESADDADGDAAAEVAAWRKLRDDAAAIAAKAHRLVEESRRKREQVAREERIRQERDEIKTIKAEALRQREEKNYAREALLRGVDAMVQAGSKSSTGEVTKNSAPFDSLLKFERPPADITKIMSEPKGAEVESKVTAQRAPLPDPFSDLSSWAAGLPESTSSKKLESMALIDDIGLGITWISPMPVKLNGNFCDVFEGMHVEVGKVALKRPRIGSAGSDDMVVRRFEREAATWRNLRHPHILKFLGTFRRDGHVYFVSPFINNGTLVEYLALQPHTNRIRLLCETADAVQYLHGGGVVHGNIKASNILINDGGHSLLCDFGLTKAVDSRTTTAMQGAGTFRWQSPELWNNAPKSFESDVYAFGMTIAEVLSGGVPFHDLINDMAVMYAVMLGDERPPKIPVESSSGISYERIWDVASDCWRKTPSDRIPMSEAYQRIRTDPSLA